LATEAQSAQSVPLVRTHGRKTALTPPFGNYGVFSVSSVAPWQTKSSWELKE